MDSFWWRLTHLEPAVWRGFVVAVVLLLTSLGVVISPDIPDAVTEAKSSDIVAAARASG